jgi:hypothetical protein
MNSEKSDVVDVVVQSYRTKEEKVKMLKSRFSWISLLLILVLALTACPGGTEEAPPQQVGEPVVEPTPEPPVEEPAAEEPTTQEPWRRRVFSASRRGRTL